MRRLNCNSANSILWRSLQKKYKLYKFINRADAKVIPSHPCFQIDGFSIQFLSQTTARCLTTLTKVKEFQKEVCDHKLISVK